MVFLPNGRQLKLSLENPKKNNIFYYKGEINMKLKNNNKEDLTCL